MAQCDYDLTPSLLYSLGRFKVQMFDGLIFENEESKTNSSIVFVI